MKFIGHRFVFAAAAAFLSFAGKGDDAVGVMSIDAGTNGSIVTNAVFDRGVSAMFSPSISDYDKADILAFHIPAVSSQAGKVSIRDSHLKKDFKFHNYFDNKFSEQTYLAYLCRGNKRYVIRSGDYIPRFIIDTIDFIIRCNNAIARRGSVQNAIDNIKQMYIRSGRHYYSFTRDVSLNNIYASVNKDD